MNDRGFLTSFHSKPWVRALPLVWALSSVESIEKSKSWALSGGLGLGVGILVLFGLALSAAEFPAG